MSDTGLHRGMHLRGGGEQFPEPFSQSVTPFEDQRVREEVCPHVWRVRGDERLDIVLVVRVKLQLHYALGG